MTIRSAAVLWAIARNVIVQAKHWALARKLLLFLSVQTVVITLIVAAVKFCGSVSDFVLGTEEGLAIFVGVILFWFLLIILVIIFKEDHPINVILLVLLTMAMGFIAGSSCAFMKGKFIFEATGFTAVSVIGLNVYGFLVKGKAREFTFTGQYVFSILVVLITFCIIKFIFRLGDLVLMSIGCGVAIIASALTISRVQTVIREYDNTHYVVASVLSLYVDNAGYFLGYLGCCSPAQIVVLGERRRERERERKRKRERKRERV